MIATNNNSRKEVANTLSLLFLVLILMLLVYAVLPSTNSIKGTEETNSNGFEESEAVSVANTQ
jgi:hypothetical protein